MNEEFLAEQLKKYFGYDAFRGPQLGAILAIMNGDDVLVRAATGVGKSLCYQLPAAMASDRSVVVVISPLIALMLDQTTQMKRRNISALYLASDHEDPLDEQQLMAGDIRIAYMSPERAVTHIDFLQQLHSSTRISLFAIDECHTVSEWGHDFRPAYRQLALLRDTFPNVPIIALTATATPKVMSDVGKVLHMNPARLKQFSVSLERTNLRYAVHLKSSLSHDMEALIQSGVIQRPNYAVKPFVTPPAVIVYCATRSNTEACCSTLRGLGVRVGGFHAGLE